MKKILLTIAISFVLLGITVGGADAQGTAPNIKVSLALDKTVYLLNEPIKIRITLENQNVSPAPSIITSEGFTSKLFHLLFTFIDPDGKGITADLWQSLSTDPDPPQIIDIGGVLTQVEPVELIDNGWILTLTLNNAHDSYSLSKAGRYSVTEIIPMRTYPSYQTIGGELYALIDSYDWTDSLKSNTVYFSMVADADGDGYYYPEAYGQYTVADCDDTNPDINPGKQEIPGNSIDENCNPADNGDVVAKGTIAVKVEKRTVGSGSHPGSTKEPIVGMPVRVFDKSTGSCVSRFGVSWQHYKSIWLSCFPPEGGIGTTDGTGTVSLSVPPGNYLVIGEYDSEIYPGVSVGSVEAGQTAQKYLQVIVKADGKKVPAKYTTKTGSELMIIEPEYVEWDGTQELYPFVFESIEDWSVTTSVNPPEGFIADYNSLTEDVNTEFEAVQFTITDMGSKWENTKVEHRIKHKGKTEIIKSKIGMRCSEGLAERKGFNRLCEKIKKK